MKRILLFATAVLSLVAPAHAGTKKPLVLSATGQVQPVQTGDAIPVTVMAPDSASNSQIVRTIASAPTYTFPEAPTTMFAGDFSKTVLPFQITVSGSATLGQPTTGYQWVPNVSGIQGKFINNGGGWNQGTADNTGRTGAAAVRIYAENNGNGDWGGLYVNCQIGGTGRAGATHWLAQPACVLFNGDIGTTLAHSYLNKFEFSLSDNGVDAAAIGEVLRFSRTVNTASEGEVWFGYRGQSIGSKAINAHVVSAGLVNVGLDTVTATADSTWNGGKTVAVNMAADQKIVLNSTATALNGLTLYGNSLGSAFIVYNSGSGFAGLCNDSCVQVAGKIGYLSGANASGAVSFSASNSDSSGSSAAQVGATHGSGSSVTISAGSTYGTVNSATQSLGLQVAGVTYMTVGTDGNLYAANGAGVQLSKKTVAALPTCNAGAEGRLYAVTDANSSTFNAALAGGGSNHVIAYCNGSGWTVH